MRFCAWIEGWFFFLWKLIFYFEIDHRHGTYLHFLLDIKRFSIVIVIIIRSKTSKKGLLGTFKLNDIQCSENIGYTCASSRSANKSIDLWLNLPSAINLNLDLSTASSSPFHRNGEYAAIAIDYFIASGSGSMKRQSASKLVALFYFYKILYFILTGSSWVGAEISWMRRKW